MAGSARSMFRSSALPFAVACVALFGSACGSNDDGAADGTHGAAPPGAGGSVSGAPSGVPSPSAGAASGVAAASRCKVTAESVFCTHNVTPLTAGTARRDVYWQTPLTPAPPGGYPVVVMYQGSFAGPSLTWATLTPSAAFAGFQQGRLQAMLLDHGFTVIAPSAAVGVAWQTNSGIPYDASTDKGVIDALLAAIEVGQYGPADKARLYATGISSGGYMTSRMAVSHEGKFRALAVHSGSYATCLGSVCNIPSLPSDHPPTLILQGAKDNLVPIATAQSYHDKLVASGLESTMVVDPMAGHEWLTVSPERITDWFSTH